MRYVCSDIHGEYRKFLKLLDAISFSDDDELFILGDVIDRGPEPVDCLLHALAEPNIHLLIGNHEQMLLECTNDSGPEWQRWLDNGSQTTAKQLGRLSKDANDAVRRALRACPLVIPDLQVGGRHYYLVHAAPISDVLNEPLIYDDADESQIETAVWARDFGFAGAHPKEMYPPTVYEHYRGTTVIIGHIPTSFVPYGRKTKNGRPRISKAWHGHLINLDCGCVFGNDLGCIRLEDHKEFYVS